MARIGGERDRIAPDCISRLKVPKRSSGLRIEREDVPAMRFDDKAHNSDKMQGEELESALSVRNLALLGRILAIACLKRAESRGAHFRLDYPETDDVHWRVVTRLQLGAGDALEFDTDPIKDPATSSAPSETIAAK